jgi:Transposase.
VHLEWYECKGEAFLRQIITIDETWSKAYEPQLKRQSNEWHHSESPQKVTVCPTGTNVKTMLIITYDWDGVILRHTFPQGHAVTAEHYYEFCEHTCEQLYEENDDPS